MKHEDFNGFWVSAKSGTPAMSSLNKIWFLISGVGVSPKKSEKQHVIWKNVKSTQGIQLWLINGCWVEGCPIKQPKRYMRIYENRWHPKWLAAHSFPMSTCTVSGINQCLSTQKVDKPILRDLRSVVHGCTWPFWKIPQGFHCHD